MKIEDWKGLNFQEIRNHKELLEEYDGYIPLIFHKHISNTNRIEYLDKNNQEKILEEIYNKRMEFKKTEDKIDWLIQDVVGWVNKNPFFEVLIVK